MFNTTDPHLLRKLLNAYPIIMFAAQRSSRHHAFRVICINQAHETSSGIRNDDVEGMRPTDILPPEEGAAVEGRYSLCARSAKTIHYEETLHFRPSPTFWRTTLFPVPMTGTVERIIGSSIELERSINAPTLMSGETAERAFEAAHARSTASGKRAGIPIRAATISLGLSQFVDPYAMPQSGIANPASVARPTAEMKETDP